jgi:hypothetical protein
MCAGSEEYGLPLSCTFCSFTKTVEYVNFVEAMPLCRLTEKIGSTTNRFAPLFLSFFSPFGKQWCGFGSYAFYPWILIRDKLFLDPGYGSNSNFCELKNCEIYGPKKVYNLFIFFPFLLLNPGLEIEKKTRSGMDINLIRDPQHWREW